MSDGAPAIRMFDVPVTIVVPEFALEDVREDLDPVDDVDERTVKQHLLDRVNFQPAYVTEDGEDAADTILEALQDGQND